MRTNLLLSLPDFARALPFGQEPQENQPLPEERDRQGQRQKTKKKVAHTKGKQKHDLFLNSTNTCNTAQLSQTPGLSSFHQEIRRSFFVIMATFSYMQYQYKPQGLKQTSLTLTVNPL